MSLESIALFNLYTLTLRALALENRSKGISFLECNYKESVASFLAKIASLLGAPDKAIWLAQIYFTDLAEGVLLHFVNMNFCATQDMPLLRWKKY